MRRSLSWISLCAVALALAGCGNKGPLFMPAAKPATPAAVPAKPAAPAPTASAATPAPASSSL